MGSRVLKVLISVLLVATCLQRTALSQSKEWVIFEDTGSFSSALVDHHGRVWMGGSRLAMFDGTSWSYFDESNSAMLRGSVTSLALDTTGNVWVGVMNDPYGGGLVRIDATGRELQPNDWEASFPNTQVYVVAADSAGRVWHASLEPKLGHPNPVRVFEESEWKVSPLLSDSLIYVSQMEAGRDSTIWAVLWDQVDYAAETYLNVLFRFDGDAWRQVDTVPVDTGRVRDLDVDGSSNLWIGTSMEGLLQFDGTAFTELDSSNSPLPADRVESLAIEDGEVLWMGTPKGLAKFDGQEWVVYDTTNSGLPTNDVRTIAVDRDGNKWIAMRGECGTSCEGTVAVFREGGVVDVGVEELPEVTIRDDLLENYPNPFRATTTIAYELDRSERVTMRVYDLLGRELALLVDSWRSSGRHEVVFDASNLPGGVYLIQLRTEGQLRVLRTTSVK